MTKSKKEGRKNSRNPSTPKRQQPRKRTSNSIQPLLQPTPLIQPLTPLLYFPVPIYGGKTAHRAMVRLLGAEGVEERDESASRLGEVSYCADVDGGWVPQG